MTKENKEKIELKKNLQKVYKPLIVNNSNILPGNLQRLPDDYFFENTLVFIDAGFLSKLSKYFGNGKYLFYDFGEINSNSNEHFVNFKNDSQNANSHFQVGDKKVTKFISPSHKSNFINKNDMQNYFCSSSPKPRQTPHFSVEYKTEGFGDVKNGIEIVEPSKNMSDSYMGMAEESLKMIKKNEESRIWTASTSYYTIYYSLYSLMMKIGIKCEIHQCSIEFMKHFLNFYSKEDLDLIKLSFEIRNDLQYYPDKLVSNDKLDFVKKEAVNFFIKTKEILSKLSEKEIREIRKKAEEERDEKRNKEKK